MDLEVRRHCTVYRISEGRQQYAYLNVYNDGYVNLDSWYWHGSRHNRDAGARTEEYYAVESEIWEWLVNNELVELRPIGPGDHEYFVTEKFYGSSNS